MARRKNSGIHTHRNLDGTSSGSKLFDACFDALCKHDKAKNRSATAAAEKDLKDLNDANIDINKCMNWHRNIVILTMQYLKRHGNVTNIARLIDWLCHQGTPIHPNASPGAGLTVGAVRIILKSAFGITGVRGRKPGR